MIEKIKQLRQETGASLGEIRSAIAESGGDLGRAREILAVKLGAIAEDKAGRTLSAGVVDAYLHPTGRIGAMVELHCETDFVARNPEFRALAHAMAMHIAAMAPPDREALLEQEFIRDPSRRVGDIIREAAGRFGENVQLADFTRFEV